MVTTGYASSTPHILAVDNDQAILSLYRELLTDEGYRVTTTLHVDRDLTEIARLAPDLIILDYIWPADDARWSLLEMLQMNPDTEAIPIILCTGAVRDVEARRERLASTGVRVVSKPFDIEHLLDVITEVLAAAAVNPARAMRSHGMMHQMGTIPAQREEQSERCIPLTDVRDQMQLQ